MIFLFTKELQNFISAIYYVHIQGTCILNIICQKDNLLRNMITFMFYIMFYFVFQIWHINICYTRSDLRYLDVPYLKTNKQIFF